MNNTATHWIHDALLDVCAQGTTQLKWGYPEPWVQTELFAQLERRKDESGWIPLQTEVPYVTHTPVQLPKSEQRNWRRDGAVKWADMCLHTTDGTEWTWFELKVRHAGSADRLEVAAKDSWNAVRKDMVGLLGFDVARTAAMWKAPDWYTRAYWSSEVLAPRANELRKGIHTFVFVYLNVGAGIDHEWLDEDAISQGVELWWNHRMAKLERKTKKRPAYDIWLHEAPEGHGIVMSSGRLDEGY